MSPQGMALVTISLRVLGVKWNPWKQLLVLANAQVPLNRNSGLRS